MGVATATGPWAHTLRLSAGVAAASNGAPITPATASAPGPAAWKGNGRRGGGETLPSTWELTCGVAPGARQSKMPGCLLPTLRIRPPTLWVVPTRDPLHWRDARAATQLRGVAGMGL